MPLLILGLNHQTALLPIREQFAISSQAMAPLFRAFAAAGISEVVVLSTCNRTEIYCLVDQADLVVTLLCDFCQVTPSSVADVWYVHHEQAAMRHLVHVAAGLDSMILGEPQILGQVKQAYAMAQAAGMVGSHLHRIFQHCFYLTKKIRSETNIGKNPVSVAFAAVTLAKHIFVRLTDCNVVLLGAGDTIQLVARYFQRQGVKRFNFVNRTLKHAQYLADCFQADAFELTELTSVLNEADIVVVATESKQLLVSQSMLQQRMKKMGSGPILLLDLSVPRNIEQKIADFDDCYLYSIDDLQAILLDNCEQRRDAAEIAKAIIEHEVDQFFKKQKIAQHGYKIEQFNRQVAAMIAEFEQEVQQIEQCNEIIHRAKKIVKRMQHQTLKFFSDSH